MARYPKAIWRPIDRYQPGGNRCLPMSKVRRLGLHTAVTSARSLYGYCSQPGRPVPHFYLAADGTIEQMIDTAFCSGASLEGNVDSITVETQDKGAPYFPDWQGADVPAWTPAQLQALAELAVWCHKTHGLKLQLCPSSLPGTEGLAPHRLGINPWRVPGGELWSGYRGKQCPGDRRIVQIPHIVSRAKAILAPPTTWELSVKNLDLRNAHNRLVRGSGVVPLQALMNVVIRKYGLGSELAENGLAGPKTRAALGRVQKRLGLKADYIAGQRTYEKLLRE